MDYHVAHKALADGVVRTRFGLMGFVAALFLLGCTDGTPDHPSAPTPRPLDIPPVAGVTVIGPRIMKIGEMQPFQFAVRLEDGSRLDVEKLDWSSDDPPVARVDVRGIVTAIASGGTTIRAGFGGKQGQQPLRVVPEYAGTWTGQYRVTACQGGADPRTCGRIIFPDPNRDARLTLTMNQELASGTFIWNASSDVLAANTTIPISGVIRLAGALVLEGFRPSTDTRERELGMGTRLTNWNAVLNGQGRLIGGFTLTTTGLTFGGIAVTMRLECDIVDGLTRQQMTLHKVTVVRLRLVQDQHTFHCAV